MADAVVSFVVNQMGAMLKDEANLLIGVEQEIKKLSHKFKSIQAVLVEAEKQQATNETIRDWLGNLKEVAYEVEDILDEWRTDAFRSQGDEDDALNHKKVHSCLLFPCLCFKKVEFRHDIGQKIREITERLNEISVQKKDFGFKGHNEANERLSIPKKEKRETTSLIDESEMFGRDQHKESIIDQLIGETSQEEKSLSIVLIVGMGGLGKTALAQLVNNDERVKKHFEKRIWVCVSDPFDVNIIASTVIEKMGGPKLENPNWETLQRSLQEVAGKMRFLLVLDDVWNKSYTEWEKLWLPLKSAGRGSKVVVTTRNRELADVMKTTLVHELGTLSHSDCCKLFKSRALKGTEEENCQELIEVGEKIVERCKGVPLAVRAVGSLLRGRRKALYWKKVLESKIWEWEVPEGDDILPALLLSYYSLPLHLKRCFSFCSVFPKDHPIKKDELVQLWMAHGFIKSEGVNIEEFGEKYFDDLYTLSLFQDAEKDDDGNIVSCMMHDLVHDLATFVTSGDCCLMEIGKSNLPSNNCHHLSLAGKFDVSSIPSPLDRVARLRTLIMFESSSIEVAPDSLFHNRRFLRALDLSGTEIENLPSSVGELKHLRYLNLNGLKIKELPESVNDLCNLQTLKLNFCSELCLLPSGISKLVKLQHLEIKCTLDLDFIPKGLGRLTSLRTLTKFPVGDENKGCRIEELKNLNLLRGELTIQNLERVIGVEEARKAELNKKCNLQSLSLHCNYMTDEDWRMLGHDEMKKMESVFEALVPAHSNLKELEIENYAGSKFPSWLEDSIFSSLVKVTLWACNKFSRLPGFWKLPLLKYLEIVGADEVKVVGGEFYGGGDDRVKGIMFPKLEELSFSFLSNWEEWKLTEKYGDAMPSLKILNVSNCCKLKALPDRLPSTLTTVVVEECDEVTWMPSSPLPLLENLSLPGNALGTFFKSLPGLLPSLKTLTIDGAFHESLFSDKWKLLESLHTLEINRCPELASLPDRLGQLKALRTLTISNCFQSLSLPEWLGQLEALESIAIQSCNGLRSLSDGLVQLKALQNLDIGYCSQLSSLPEGLGQLEALCALYIHHCNALTSLPDGLGQLKSLRHLHVGSCPNLKPLPNLRHLNMLEFLKIYNCPLVTERLEKEKGEDWCNISHIPTVLIDGRRIQ